MTVATWAPPAGWVRLPSTVDGVDVWGPRPRDEADTDAPEGSFRCAQCGGTVGFDVAQGAAACGFCGHLAAPAAPVVGRAARAEAFTDAAIAAASQGWALARQQLHCDGCSVDLAVEPGDLATTCAFCGSSSVLLRGDVVQSLRPSAVVPFAVAGDKLAEAVRGWLGRGWMHPPDLAKGAVLDRIAGVYVPFWGFDALAHARWRAEVGERRTRTVWRDGERKTESYIHWSWKNGTFDLGLRDYLECGSARIPQALLDEVGWFELGALVEYRPELLAGFRAQSYDVGLTEAWDTGRRRMRETVRAACERDTGSDHVRNLYVEADLDEERWRYLLLPLHLGAYDYGGRTWHVLVNGQTGKIVGHKPVLWWKVWAAVAASFLPAAAVALIGLVLLIVGVGAILLFVALVLAGIAGWWSWTTVQAALRSEGGRG